MVETGRRLLYAAGPYLSLASPLLGIYVDLERPTKEGQLVRHPKPPSGRNRHDLVLGDAGPRAVEPDRTPPRFMNAEASMEHGPPSEHAAGA